MADELPDPQRPPGAGLCATCHHARVVSSARSRFLRCKRSDEDPSYERYPRLPVVRCAGFEVSGPSRR